MAQDPTPARPRRAGVGGVLLLCGSLMLTLGCGRPGAPASGGSPRAGTLVVGLAADVDSWNPYTSNEATAAGILELVYPRLLLELPGDAGGSEFVPWLAESWEFSPDRKELTFHLRPDARWTDGAPVTCEDVRFTHRMQLDEHLAWPGAFVKERIEDVSCADERTVLFRFAEAYADQLLDANDDAIVPSAYAAVDPADWSATTWEDRFVGCGPFKLATVTAGQEAVLERNPTWWGDPDTGLERIVLRVYPDTVALLARLSDGDVDFVPNVPALDAARLKDAPALRLIDLPSLSYTFLGWNTLAPGAYREDRRARGCDGEDDCPESEADVARLRREHPHPILADARVRLALTLAIDRQDIVDGVWAGRATIGSSPIVSAQWAHLASAGLPFAPDRATELLRDAGWKDNDGDGVLDRGGRRLELRVIVNSENQIRRDALARAAASLARIGVRLTAEPLPRGEFVERARAKDFDVVLSGWWAGTRIEPQSMMHGRAAPGRGNNLTSWSDPESDALLDRAAAATSREEALPLWHAWQELGGCSAPAGALTARHPPT